jgi:Xaa-Pro aminopeptidase
VIVDGRLAQLREQLRSSGLEAFAVTNPVNIAYLTGFEGVFDTEQAHAAVVSADSAWLYTDSRYFEAARSAAEGGQWEVRLLKEGVYAAVAFALTAAELCSIAVESTMTLAQHRELSAQHAGSIEAVDGWVERIRQTKQPLEIDRITAAQQLTDEAFTHILSRIHPGARERDIALALECYMRSQGSEGVAFDPIVASGPNSAMPHAKVTAREIEAGDFVKLDFGARVGGYCADMTRTVVVGSASERQREIYGAVHAANLAGIQAVKAGVPGRQADAAAREVLTERGFGEYFGHGLGHGVGLEVHELPGLGPRSEAALPAGAVVTVEPGVYLPGFGGVRIEDLVVVEEGGVRVLTRSTKDLIEL